MLYSVYCSVFQRQRDHVLYTTTNIQHDMCSIRFRNKLFLWTGFVMNDSKDSEVQRLLVRMSLMNPSDEFFSSVNPWKFIITFNEAISLLLLPKPPRKQKYILCLSVYLKIHLWSCSSSYLYQHWHVGNAMKLLQ